jgi:hypothetical protein
VNLDDKEKREKREKGEKRTTSDESWESQRRLPLHNGMRDHCDPLD